MQPELQSLLFLSTANYMIVFRVIPLNFDYVLIIISLKVFRATVISFPVLSLRNSKIIVGNSHVEDLSRF